MVLLPLFVAPRGLKDFKFLHTNLVVDGLFIENPTLIKTLAITHGAPERRLESCKRERVKVDSGSLIYAGEEVEARLYVERVEVWYGQKKVEEMPRLRGRSRHRSSLTRY